MACRCGRSGRSRCKSCCNSRNKRNTYMAHNEHIVDRVSRQLLFNDFDVNMMGRTRLKTGERFNDVTANGLIAKHLKKKKASGSVSFLIDRMRFKKSCCTCCRREYLNYREVKEMYTFPSYPNAFMLGVHEEKSNKRYYETYSCKNPGDTARIQQLLERTSTDPERLLRSEAINTRSSSYIPETTVPNVVAKDPQPRMARSTSVPVSRTTSPMPSPVTGRYNDYPPYGATRVSEYPVAVNHVRQPSPPVVLQYQPIQMQAPSVPRTPDRVIPVRAYSPIQSIPQPVQRSKPMPTSYSAEQIPDLYRNNRVVSIPGTPKSQGHLRSFDLDDLSSMNPEAVTFLTPNTTQGLEVVERGSVYLYASREQVQALPVS